MKVEVRPIPVNKWHGKKGKESFARPKDIEALFDPKTQAYATGLTPEEAKKYGEILKVDLSDTFNYDVPHVFWSSKQAMIRLENQTMFFDTNRTIDLIKVKLMKAHKKVANSMKEYEDGLWPDATHVIFDEAEEINSKASKVALKEEAIVFKTKMSAEDKSNMIQILSNKTARGMSDNFLNVELSAIIDEKPGEFLKFAKMGREEVNMRAAVLEALFKNVLTKEGSAIFYMGDQIAFDYEEAVQWFKNPQNSRLKVAILEKLISK